MECDLGSPGGVALLVRKVTGRLGRCDVLVNCAGLMLFRPFGEVSLDTWRRIQAVHVDGSFYCCREALKMMNARMTGSIINMASVVGTSGRGPVPYATAKAAILGLTRSLANEVALRGIRVNAIAPGWIKTDMTAPFRQLLKDVPFGLPDDVDTFALMPIGWPLDSFGPLRRRPLSEVVHADRWGAAWTA